MIPLPCINGNPWRAESFHCTNSPLEFLYFQMYPYDRLKRGSPHNLPPRQAYYQLPRLKRSKVSTEEPRYIRTNLEPISRSFYVVKIMKAHNVNHDESYLITVITNGDIKCWYMV
eukprot:TRINITY_DN27283_c0_g1_i1.p1 TRINITY_DN27283_c0_g1~~TRINITY_DN27283_c0_g1_i1.p1  ORF type:complete len:115 (+),score=7.18 TRINITY_DN27283_c0_g1_i1:405-749(+)